MHTTTTLRITNPHSDDPFTIIIYDWPERACCKRDAEESCTAHGEAVYGVRRRISTVIEIGFWPSRFPRTCAMIGRVTIKRRFGPTRAEPVLMSVSKILPLAQAIERMRELKRQGKRVVFTNGCFDLLHPGHTRYLAAARMLGDVLVVALNSDRSVAALKGPDRPITPESERAEVVAALAAVDYVTIFDDLTPQAVIGRMLPRVLVKGADWGPNEIVGREEVEAAGGEVVSIPL